MISQAGEGLKVKQLLWVLDQALDEANGKGSKEKTRKTTPMTFDEKVQKIDTARLD